MSGAKRQCCCKDPCVYCPSELTPVTITLTTQDIAFCDGCMGISSKYLWNPTPNVSPNGTFVLPRLPDALWQAYPCTWWKAFEVTAGTLEEFYNTCTGTPVNTYDITWMTVRVIRTNLYWVATVDYQTTTEPTVAFVNNPAYYWSSVATNCEGATFPDNYYWCNYGDGFPSGSSIAHDGTASMTVQL